jgi:hypothetical protein
MTPDEVFKDHNHFNKLIEIIVKKGNLHIIKLILNHCHTYIFSLGSKLTAIGYKLFEYTSYLRKHDQVRHKNNILEFYNLYIRLFAKHNKYDHIPWHYLAESYMLLKDKTTCIKLLEDRLLDDFLVRYHHILLRLKIRKAHTRLFKSLVRLKIPIPRDMIGHNLPILKNNRELLLQVLHLIDGEIYHNTFIDIFKHAILHNDSELMQVIADKSDVSLVIMSMDLIIGNDDPIVWKYISLRLQGYTIQFSDIYKCKYGYKNPIAKNIVKFVKSNIVELSFHIQEILELAIDANDKSYFNDIIQNNPTKVKPFDYRVLKIFAHSIQCYWEEFNI